MLRIIVPILVGGVIGYCTNYIAIKMLFRPRHEVHIGKWKLPFTPGVIPKNQKRIAQAVGNAVSNQLITEEDLLKEIAKSGVKERLADAVADGLFHSKQQKSIPGVYMDSLAAVLSEDIMAEVEGIDFMPIIRDIGAQSLQEFLANPMIAMFLNEAMLDGIYHRVDLSIRTYVRENGQRILDEFLEKKMERLSDASTAELLNKAGVKEIEIKSLVGTLFDEFVTTHGEDMIKSIDIRGIVIAKIEAMKVEELEALVMYVMENELKTVINLGAIIGALIGIVNIFI